MSFQWNPPYIYKGLYKVEVWESEGQQDLHVQFYKEREEELSWKMRCEQGGMHRYGHCPYCGYFYD